MRGGCFQNGTGILICPLSKIPVVVAFVLIGFLTRPAAIFQVIILVGAMVMFGFEFTTGPSIWKDPAILGVAVGLSIYGSGKFGLDTLISRKFKSN